MKKNAILFTMNLILAHAAAGQGTPPLKAAPNWLAAIHATFGPGALAGWFMDLDADGMEVYLAPENSLVLVDRSPIVEGNGESYLRSPMRGLGGTHLRLIGEVEHISDRVLHGVYSGRLGGTAVMMDQYVQLRNCVPIAIVRVIARVNGSAPPATFDREELVTRLLDRTLDAGKPAPDRDLCSGDATGD